MEIKLILVFVVAFCSVVLAENDDDYEYDDYWPGDANSASAADDYNIIGDKPPDPDNNDHFYAEPQENLEENKNYDLEQAADESSVKSNDDSVQDTDTKVNEEIHQFLGDVDVDLGQDAKALDENDYQVEDNRPVLEEVQMKSDEDDGFQIEIAEISELPSPDIVVETKDLLEDTDSEMDINLDKNSLDNDGIIKDANLEEIDANEKNNRNVNEDEVKSLKPEEINEIDEEDPIEDAKIVSKVQVVRQKSQKENNVNYLSSESNNYDENNNNETFANSADDNDQVNRESNSKESVAVDQDQSELKEESVVEKGDGDDNVEDDLRESIKELNSIFDDLVQSEDSFEQGDFEEDNFEDIPTLVEDEKSGRPFREDYVLGLRDQLMNDEANINDDSFNIEMNENDQNNFDDQNDVDDLDEVVDNNVVAESIPYLKDAIYSENKADIVNGNDIINNDDIESDDSEIAVDHVDQLLDLVKEAHVLFSPNLNNLTDSELEDLDKQFSVDHKEELDFDSDDFDRNVAPVLVNLELGVPVVVTSPNYPEPYPTNNIIDWIFEGRGMGIELNITDLSVNGFMGDYLLVKPGGIDESGHEGLLFSYQLRSERRYRFLDVNRLFVRFEALPGMAFNRGFSYSVKLLSPLPEPEEPMPEPEPVVTLPDETLLVFLGGVTTEEFANITDDFRLIVADMATLYTNANSIDTGNVTFGDVTHITMVQVCHITWPGFEHCAGVRFGVQLDDVTGLTEAQLDHMWRAYVNRDPFASRLRRLGVNEFAVPNDSTTLMVWLVIGLGAAISAGMLALALWRWTCYDEYTRMPTFNDTDSIISEKKKRLDLYPTPHQTLPPLYTDEFIKYEDSARVDMGGFANQSYVRDADLYDIESDDDMGALPGDKQHRSTTDV